MDTEREALLANCVKGRGLREVFTAIDEDSVIFARKAPAGPAQV